MRHVNVAQPRMRRRNESWGLESSVSFPYEISNLSYQTRLTKTYPVAATFLSSRPPM